jgi:branched-chain amino acid transport system substrate-binding protein
MRRSNLVRHCLTAAFAVAFGAGALSVSIARAEDGVSSSDITIGAIGALTGPLAFIGAPGRDSLTLGFNEINAKGGVCGRKLKLDYENASTPAESLAAVKKLVEQDKVFILVLASGSTGAAAAADYLRQVGVPTYNLYGSTPIIRNPFSPNIFHGAIVPVDVAAPDLISLFYDGNRKPKKFGVLAGTYAFPQATLVAVKKVMNKKKLDYMVEQFDQSARDFTSQLVAFSRAKVDSILVLGSFSEAGFAIKQARQLGLTNVQWVLDASAVNSAIIPIIGNADGLRGYFNVPAFPGQTPEMKEFEARLKKQLGSMPQGRPNVYDMIGYGASYVMAEAIKATGCKLTRKDLLNAWSHLKDAGPAKMGGLPVFFPESFSPTDHQGNYKLGAATVKDGKWRVYGVMQKP